MATTTTTTNKPLNPRAQDLSPKGYNRANIFSGKALSFDGVNDLIDVTEAASLDFATNFTYVAYVNLAASQSSRIFYSNYFDSSSVGAGFGISDTTNNQVKFYTKGAGAANTLLSSTLLNVGQWYQVITTYDGTTKKMYINGRLDASVAYTDSVTYTSATNRVGALSGTSAQFFSGLIAGLRVFNVALTAAQVSDLYLNPEKIVPDGVASSALKLWLPMMEGAGASAYDGSGNGNDGTINGATWTAGIGAPVAQTALVSWDKGVNLATHSEDFANGAWTKISTSVAFNTATAPNGTMTADSLNSTSSTEAIFQLAQANTIDFSVYAKAGTTTSLQLASSVSFNGRAADFNLSTGTAGAVYQLGTGDPSISGGTSSIESVGNGWYKCSINSLVLSSARAVTIANNNGNLSYIWGASLRPTSAGDAYIKTNATAQTSAVLVPEGLTAGASIFGTDIITPRNAFALNLDGASWAQVGDNASLDFGTGALTLECWAKADYVNQGSGANAIISLGGDITDPNTGGLTSTSSVFGFWLGGANIATGSYVAKSWNHIVGVRSGSTLTIYLNGAQVTTGTNSNSITNASPKEIGRDAFAGVRFYQNQLANPRIYNRALTAAEVLRNYNADKAKFGL